MKLSKITSSEFVNENDIEKLNHFLLSQDITKINKFIEFLEWFNHSKIKINFSIEVAADLELPKNEEVLDYNLKLPKYFCQFCNKQYKNNYYLDRHIKTPKHHKNFKQLTKPTDKYDGVLPKWFN